MAIDSRIALKTYFETGDRPTQAQFVNLIDSFLSLIDDTSDDIIEGTVKRFMTAAEKVKLAAITQVVATTIDTGALTAGVSKEITHSLNVTTASTILIARNDADTNNITVAELYPSSVNAFMIRSNVNLSNLKVKLIGFSA